MELKPPAPLNVVALPSASNCRAPEDFKVVAIIAAFNEGDIIGAAMEHLWRQGVQVAFIDHGSTDDTVEVVRRFEGKNLVHLERFPEESGFPAEEANVYRWKSLLRRKEQLAQKLDAAWFIHHDADELRESPWPGLRLVDGLHLVQQCGFTAVDFEVLQFRPVTDAYQPGDDLLQAFPWFERPEWFDRVQVKCWKNCGPVSLADNAGHDVQFAARRVFPVRFLLRHYPVRSQAQGERKVFTERHGRYAPEERSGGWHVQYDGMKPGQQFVRATTEGLLRYEPEVERARLLLQSRAVEELEKAVEQARAAGAAAGEALAAERAQGAAKLETARRALQAALEQVTGLELALFEQRAAARLAAARAEALEAEVRRLEAGLASSQAGLARSEGERARAEAELARAGAELADAAARAGRLEQTAQALSQHAQQVEAALRESNALVEWMKHTLSWKLTEPLRHPAVRRARKVVRELRKK